MTWDSAENQPFFVNRPGKFNNSTKTSMALITRKTTIEDLVKLKPEAINYLFRKGIRCIRCGEPIWGSLEQAALEKGFSDADIDLFVKELNQLTS